MADSEERIGIASDVLDAGVEAETRLRSAMARTESTVRRLVDSNIIGIVWSNNRGDILDANDAFLRIVGYSREQLEAGEVRWLDMTPPEWLPLDDNAIRELDTIGTFETYEKEYIRKDGTRVPVLLGGARLEGGCGDEQICYILDLSKQKEAESALRFIAEAGVALARSLDLQTTLETLLGLLVPSHGDWAAINVREADGRIKTVAARHSDPLRADLALRLVGSYSHNPNSMMGTANVYRTGRSVIFESLTGVEIRTALLPEYHESFFALGLGSFAIVPISLGESVIGTLGIGSMGHGRRFTAAELTVLEELAMRAALAIENARVYEREHRVAFELQKAALPSSLPDVPGFALDSVYEAGRSEALIGGDWYDAVRLPDGRTVISIGDVAGSGIAAAVTMANMRQVIRGTALAYGDPWIVLETADRALRADDPGRFVTAFVGVLDPVTETLTYASAGHPMPLVRAADGSVSELPGPVGAPLGLRTGRAEAAPPIALQPDSLIVLYTDGLIESTRDIAAGERTLREALATISPDADGVAAALRFRVLGEEGAPDDVAILTVRVLGGAVVRRWTFASHDAQSAQRVRLEIIALLRDAGATPEQVLDAEVIFSELIANVVRHAPGIVEAALDFSAPSPVLHILDCGRAGATEHDGVDALLESGRGLFIASRLARDVWVSPRQEGGSHARAALDVGPAHRSL